MKKILTGFLIALVATLLVALPVLAVVGNVTDLICSPEDVSIHLKWTKATTSTTTVIRYRTDEFPTSYNDGTLSYNGTGYETDITGLTAGQSYYFAAWGFDGANYSTNAYYKATTTVYTIGLSTNQTVPSPLVPANINIAPVITGFNFEPFTSIISNFVSTPGGLGMPVENTWEWLTLVGMVALSLIVYIQTKEFLIAFVILILLTAGGWYLGLTQGLLLAFEIPIALGVWGIEHAMQ
jgi:hypothetical protein